MCSYCHEFIKRNQPKCGYCGKVLSKKEEPILEISKIEEKRHLIGLFLATIALLVAVSGGYVVHQGLLFAPKKLDTLEISPPAVVELVELIPYEPWIH